MKYFGLPKDTIEFLKASRQFVYDPENCEAGLVKLLRLEALTLGEIWVNSDESPIKADDPHANDKGYYVVNSVDLVAECVAYGAEGILVWLPDYRMFGTWDCDHWDVMVFPKASWKDIVNDPARYLGAQWLPDLEIGEYLKPWDKCEFKFGRPF